MSIGYYETEHKIIVQDETDVIVKKIIIYFKKMIFPCKISKHDKIILCLKLTNGRQLHLLNKYHCDTLQGVNIICK